MRTNNLLKPEKIFFVSPWLFAAACALLAIIIGVFAVNNFQREKKLMGRALAQEGTAILNLVASGARSSLRRAFIRGDLNRENWIGSIQQVIENGSEHPRIISLYLVNEKGLVLAHNLEEKLNQDIDADTLSFLEGISLKDSHEDSRITQIAGSADPVFQIAALVHPFGNFDGPPSHMREMMRGRFGRMAERPGPPADLLDRERAFADLNRQNFFLVAELDLSDFREAVSKQRLQIAILSLVLLLVGIGGLLSLGTLQGLRGSQVRLKRIHAFNDVLVSSLPIGLIAIGPDRIIRTCNQSASAMLNLEHEITEGLRFDEIMPKQLRDLLNFEHGRQVEGRWEMRLADSSGNEKALHVVSLQIDDPEQQHAGLMLLIQDLSQIRELENELRKVERDATLGRMAAGVAHELRNPLSSIKGLALLLKTRFQQDGFAGDTVDMLVDEVERLNRSIDELLDYARPVQLVREEVDIDAVIRRAVTLIRADADAAGIKVIEEYQCASEMVGVDQDKLVQVILNLCLNSIQAMNQDGTLRIVTRKGVGKVVIEISDSGVGIEPSVMKKVFEPYFTTKNNGTGLGLAMSLKIIEDHNGSLSLSSKAGNGTTATIELPLH